MGFAVGLLTLPCAAAAPPPWLEWSPPPECPSASDIERRITEWLNGAFPTDSDILVRTRLGWDGERWEVAVEISIDGQSGTRQVRVRDCQEAADFVAITVALAVDPSLAETMAPADADERSADSTESHSDVPLQAASLRPRKSERAPVGPPAPSNARPPPLPHLSVSAEGTVGTLPDAALGLGVAAGADLARLSLSLGARWLPPNRTTPEEALAPIDFSLLGARLYAAYLLLGPRTRLGPSVALDVGTVRAKQLNTNSDAVLEPWVSVAAGGLGLLRLSDYLCVFGEFQIELPLTQPTFVLSDDSVVHRVGLGARAGAGLRFSFSGE